MNPTLPLALALAATLGCTAVAPTPEPPPSAAPPPLSNSAAPAQHAADGEAQQSAFARWLAGFRDVARAAGIPDATLHAALDGVQLLPRVVERDRAQPEFTRAVWDYLDRAVSPQRVAQGRARLAALGNEGEALAGRYGVPLAVVVAIWGIESDYGSQLGDTPVIDALATLGFDGRRADWARGELLAALRIVERGDVDRDRMVGSWAGAMGQTQFLPSNVLAYAVDADGDGRRDLWGSRADVIASTANLLAHSGWRAGEPWGAEVRLPAGFDPGRADDGLRRSSVQWSADGVRPVDGDGAPLPAFDDASLLLPAGARGPAFLVGANFRALLRYNNAGAYALAVGLLSQRLAGGAEVQAPWPRDLQPLSRSQVLALQQALNRSGFDSGTPDGLIGPMTRDALRRYQRSAGLPADGYPTVDLLRRLAGP